MQGRRGAHVSTVFEELGAEGPAEVMEAGKGLEMSVPLALPLPATRQAMTDRDWTQKYGFPVGVPCSGPLLHDPPALSDRGVSLYGGRRPSS